MAKIFLDANIIIDILERRSFDLQDLKGHSLFVSPLSLHILAYVYKYKCPSESLILALKVYNLVPLDEEVTRRSAGGPTEDFEDNIQLHSAVAAGCEYFLTSDNKLLKPAYFGNLEIRSAVPLKA